MAQTKAKEVIWERVEVLDREGLFTCCRIDRNSVPAGYHVYDIRHDDDCQGDPVQICKWVMVNHWGTLLTKEPFELEPSTCNNNAYLDIDPEEDWNYTGDCYRLTDDGKFVDAY